MRLFDLHCDTLMRCVNEHGSLYENGFDLDYRRGTALFEEWFQVMAAYVPDGLSEDTSYAMAERMLIQLRRERDALSQIDSSRSDVTSGGTFRMLAAVENGAAIGRDLRRIRMLADYGIVYMTLTWNGTNALGHGCMSHNQSGLTAFGKEVVRELYAYGIYPDVSHLNEAGFYDVFSLADGRPFLASHSLSKAVYDHPRSLTDAQFCAVRDSGGIVGLNVCHSQLGGADLSFAERHLDHFLSLGGEKTVALGLDLDGTPLPSEWQGITVVVRLYEYLEARGYPKLLLDRLFYKNSYSFFEKSLTSEEECIRIGT